MPTQANGKTSAAKSAPIIKQGHTQDGTQGSNPRATGPGVRPTVPLSPKS